MKYHIALHPHDSFERLSEAAKYARDPALKIRLKAVVLRKQHKTPQEIARLLAVTDRSVTGWIRRYNNDGLVALATKPSGRPKGNPKWDASIFDALAKEIDKGGYWSIPRMREWIREHLEKDIPEQTVWFRMDQLDYSYKSARPHPVQGNRDKQENFKKMVSFRSWSR